MPMRTRSWPLATPSWLVALLVAPLVSAAPSKPATKPGAPQTGAPQAGATPGGKPATSPATPATEPPADDVEPPTGPTDPAEPTPTEPTPTEPAPEPTTPTGPDAAAVARLQQDARALRDDLFKARARVSVVGSKLFTARIAMSFRSNLERFYTASDFTIRVDGAPVYVQEQGLPKTAGDLFEVFAAPGSHEIAISVDLVARRDPAYKLEIEETLALVVPEDARVSSRLVLRETGNMWRFASRRRGHTDLRVRLQARAKLPKGAKAAKPAGASAGVRTGGSQP